MKPIESASFGTCKNLRCVVSSELFSDCGTVFELITGNQLQAWIFNLSRCMLEYATVSEYHAHLIHRPVRSWPSEYINILWLFLQLSPRPPLFLPRSQWSPWNIILTLYRSHCFFCPMLVIACLEIWFMMQYQKSDDWCLLFWCSDNLGKVARKSWPVIT